MTSRYDESETPHGAPASDAAPDTPAEHAGSAENRDAEPDRAKPPENEPFAESVPDYGDSVYPQQYEEPATSPGWRYDGVGHPSPSYVDPSESGRHAPPRVGSPGADGLSGSGPYRTGGGTSPEQAGHVHSAPGSGQRPQFPFTAPQQDSDDHPFGQDLSTAQLLRRRKQPPRSGWRRAVYVASGHSVNVGESRAERERRELISRVNQPLQGCYKIAMLSLKGGVGKTTMTATLGSTFSSLRGDRVIALDANPDRGTLSQKIPLETTATVRHLLRDAHRIRKYSDIRAYTSQGPSRLEILASEQDPAVSEAFSEHDYRRAVTLLEHFYTIMLTDCGTGLMHSAMKGVLELADSLVIVSSGSIDGARSASGTVDWLQAHGFGELVARSVTVINSVRPGSGKVDVAKLTTHFAARCRAVVRIPFDPHLEEGAEVELDRLASPTRLALLELAATVADDFPHALGRQHS